jgi:hypothetical protein
MFDDDNKENVSMSHFETALVLIITHVAFLLVGFQAGLLFLTL